MAATMNNLLSRGTDLEVGTGALEMTGAKHLTRFHSEVAILDAEMEKVKELLRKLEQIIEESPIVTSAQSIKGVCDRLDGLIMELLRKAKLIQSKLEALDRANRESRLIPGCEEGTSVDRMRSNITNSRRGMLESLMESFDALRQKMRSEDRETTERLRYYKITGEKASEETIDRMNIENGESEPFLQKAVREQGRGQMLNTIEEIKERLDAVRQIEKNLLELHQIFLDMAVLVDAQGLPLNTIQVYAVSGARSFVDRGTQLQLTRAKKLQTISCIALILILIIIIILVSVLVPLFKK